MSESAAPRARSSAPSSRGAATAQRISASAIALVLEHGYEATTVDMICAAAGISQRTFFNHFPTKDASIIGVDGPRLDESRVRAFIASDSPSILTDAIALIAEAVAAPGSDDAFLRARMSAISSNAELMLRQVEQFAAIEAELAEIIRYRIARVSPPETSPDELVEQSHLTAHLLAGVMRYIAQALMTGDPASTRDVVEATVTRIAALLPKLG